MTQKEIYQFLDNTKVYVNGKSKEIQEKLFSLGYCWHISGSTEVSHEDKPFLFIYKSFFITYGCDMSRFIESTHREISAEEILSIELTESAYRPFKDKEECWNEMHKHYPFGWIISGTKYHLISFLSDGCIRIGDNTYFTFEEEFNKYKFADGTPFGVKKD